MTVEELIKALQIFRQIHGNLGVTVLDPNGYEKPLYFMVLSHQDNDGKPKTALLADDELLFMFESSSGSKE